MTHKTMNIIIVIINWTSKKGMRAVEQKLIINNIIIIYLAVQQAMASINRPVHSKITLPTLLRGKLTLYTAFKALLSTKADLS